MRVTSGSSCGASVQTVEGGLGWLNSEGEVCELVGLSRASVGPCAKILPVMPLDNQHTEGIYVSNLPCLRVSDAASSETGVTPSAWMHGGMSPSQLAAVLASCVTISATPGRRFLS